MGKRTDQGSTLSEGCCAAFSQKLSLVRSSDAAFDPEGRVIPPARSPSPLLDLQIRPRIQPYLETDDTGTLIVDASVREAFSITETLH